MVTPVSGPAVSWTAQSGTHRLHGGDPRQLAGGRSRRRGRRPPGAGSAARRELRVPSSACLVVCTTSPHTLPEATSSSIHSAAVRVFICC